jgi:hypothetical protein
MFTINLYEPQPQQPQYPSQDLILLLSSLKFKCLDRFNTFPKDGRGGPEYDDPLLSGANNSYAAAASVGSLVDMTETIILTELRTARQLRRRQQETLNFCDRSLSVSSKRQRQQ